MWLAACLLIGISTFALAAQLVAHYTGAKLDDNSPPILVLSSLALDGSILIAVFLFLRWENLTWVEAFGFRTRLWCALMWGVIVAVCFTPVAQEMNVLCGKAIEWYSGKAPPSEQAVESLQKAVPGFTRVYLIFFAIVIAPVSEETLFRGILYPAIRQFGFPRSALWGTSILFAAIHANLPAFLPLTLLAVVLAILYEKTSNLLACIVAHSVFNAAGVLLLYYYNGEAAPPSH
jgi:membrane protease YdiL (CAAX protease family)